MKKNKPKSTVEMTRGYVVDWLKEVAEHGMKREEVVFLIVQARQLIEGRHDISNFRVTELYCDWMLHRAIDTSDGGLAIIKELTTVLVKNWTDTADEMNEEINKVLGLRKLRLELETLFVEYSIPQEIIKIDENWNNLVGFLTYYLRHKPILFPKTDRVKKDRLKGLITEIQEIQKPADFYIKNLTIVGSNKPFWCVELGGEKDTTRIIGEMRV